MNDRELLSLAAKAIGGELSNGHTRRRTGKTWEEWEWVGEPGIATGDGWNPHPNVVIHPQSDDGDAMRLAVHLNLLTKNSFLDAMAEENEKCDGDYCCATRRAIVRAAAEIGKNMP